MKCIYCEQFRKNKDYLSNNLIDSYQAEIYDSDTDSAENVIVTTDNARDVFDFLKNGNEKTVVTNDVNRALEHIASLTGWKLSDLPVVLFDVAIANRLLNEYQGLEDIDTLCKAYSIRGFKNYSRALYLLFDILKGKLKEQGLSYRALLEMQVIPIVVDITNRGIYFDKNLFNQYKKLLENNLAVYKKSVDEQCGIDIDINKQADIVKVLEKFKVPFFKKITVKSRNGKKLSDNDYREVKLVVTGAKKEKEKVVAVIEAVWASRAVSDLAYKGFDCICNATVDEAFLEGVDKEKFPIVRLLENYRQAMQIYNKFFKDYCKYVGDDSRVRSHYTTAEALTFRMSSFEPNMQQLPAGKVIEGFDVTKATRGCFKADEKEVICKIDYSQIEFRLICNIAVGSEGEKVRARFKREPALDFHRYVSEISGLERKEAKAMNFGLAYGMGAVALQAQNKWSDEKAREIQSKYHRALPFIRPTIESVQRIAENKKYIQTILGSYCRLQDKSKLYTFLNRYAQGSCAEILKRALVFANKAGLLQELKVINLIHDEIDLSISLEQIDKVIELEKIMTSAVKSEVPLIVDTEFGDDFATCLTVHQWREEKQNNSKLWQNASEQLKETVVNYWKKIQKK